jgi:hypothetical protein
VAGADVLQNVANAGHNDDSFALLAILLKYSAIAILILISRYSYWKSNIPNFIYFWYVAFLLWSCVTIVRGGFAARGYWDWKFLLLSSALYYLTPLVFFVGKHLAFAQVIFRYYLKYFFSYGFLIIPLALLTNRELYSRLMIPVSIFILLTPWLRIKWVRLVFLVAIVSVVVVIDFRTNIIKIAISLMILTFYYFRRYATFPVRFLHFAFFLIPLIFLFLGVTGVYNVFAETSEHNNYTVKAQKGDMGEVNLAGDTRTFLYVEVLSYLTEKHSLLFGEGATGKYKTEYFDTLDNRGRYGSEVGVLNLALYSGIVGIIFYLAMLSLTSWYAIYRSNNFLCKMLGLLLASRWLLLFIEEFTNLDLNNLFTWLLIGLLSNKAFRSMTNEEVKFFLHF